MSLTEEEKQERKQLKNLCRESGINYRDALKSMLINRKASRDLERIGDRMITFSPEIDDHSTDVTKVIGACVLFLSQAALLGDPELCYDYMDLLKDRGMKYFMDHGSPSDQFEMMVNMIGDNNANPA